MTIKSYDYEKGSKITQYYAHSVEGKSITGFLGSKFNSHEFEEIMLEAGLP